MSQRKTNHWGKVLQIQADESLTDPEALNALPFRLKDMPQVCETAVCMQRCKSRTLPAVGLLILTLSWLCFCEQDSMSRVASVVMWNSKHTQNMALKRIDSSLSAILKERTENERAAEKAAKETLSALRQLNRTRGGGLSQCERNSTVLDKLQYRESAVNRYMCYATGYPICPRKLLTCEHTLPIFSCIDEFPLPILNCIG
jgi:hypothetical protein